MTRLLTAAIVSLATLTLLGGCAGRPSLLPNSDAALQKTAAEFAADAAKRFPYKADAERGGQALARAEVNYVTDIVRLVNLSDTEWTNVEVWLNGSHVVFLPRIEAKIPKVMDLQMFYDDKGQWFPTSNGAWFKREPILVNKIELYRDGKLYDVRTGPAD